MLMKFKIKKLNKGPMILTGSKVLKAIMDNATPPIDLFVREVIQNSADAILKSKEYGRIKFNIGKFDNNELCESLYEIKDNIKEKHNETEYDFISISDSNTCGLLGEASKDENGGPNNLYNLVYDFMNDKDDDGSGAGGSCGIGKSVYFRYGNGICFYYSRTKEDGVYKSKLVGTLIQDERNDSCFIGKNSSGIAYFGDLDGNNSIPINDENLICEFLSIFGLKPYEADKTGTIVIIPFTDLDALLENNNNADDDSPRYWLDSIEQCLKMSIQRWYFPRINNESFNGKYLKIAVNNQKVELCDFYQSLQDLYNGTLAGCKIEKISGKGFSPDEILGDFIYKEFTADELKIHIPPENNPYPKYFVDSNIDVDKNGLLFYTRKPGMILNYDNSEFGTYEIEENKYLIGIFKLNDELVISDEKLGIYIRKTEKSNHFEWNNDNIKDFPVLSKKKPFKKISATVRSLLNDVFKQNKAVSLESSTTILQKKYGEKLLPPQDFGEKPTIPPTPPVPPTPPIIKKNKVLINFNGLNSNGLLSYIVEFILQKDDRMKFKVDIKAGSKTYPFLNWEELGFSFPCAIRKIEIVEFYIDKSKKSFPQIISLDENFIKRRKKILDDVDIYKIKGLATKQLVPYGFVISNAMEKPLRIKMNLEIEPIDCKYSIGFNAVISKEAPNE